MEDGWLPIEAMENNTNPRKAKRTLFRILMVMVVLALVLVMAGTVVLDRDAWVSSRKLSVALKDAREVVLVEYVGVTDIARRAATPDEISRLRIATSVWWRPFFPTAYLCFVPHHRIEIRRANGSNVNTEVCFLCEKFAIENGPIVAPLSPYLSKSLASFFASVGMAPKTSDEYGAIETSKRAGENEEAKNQLK
jgi:hypothetical protein